MRYLYLLFFVLYSIRLTAQSVEMMPVGTVFHGIYFHYFGGINEYMTLRVALEEWKYGKWAKKIVRENGGSGYLEKWIYQSGDSIFGLNNPPWDTSWYFYYKNRYEVGEIVDIPPVASGGYFTVLHIDTIFSPTLPTIIYKASVNKWISDRFGPSWGLGFPMCGGMCDSPEFYICAISTPSTGILGDGIALCESIGVQIVSSSTDVQAEKNHAFSVSPNPVDQYFNLHPAKEAGPQKLLITDRLGRIVYTQQQVAGDKQIVTSNWPPGIYYVRLGYAVQPIVVMR